jgi:hypothetical protein
VPGQRQVGLLPFEDQVHEQALLVAGVLEQADQVVLLAQGDEDVLDGIVTNNELTTILSNWSPICAHLAPFLAAR